MGTTYREQCCACKTITDVEIGTTSECIGCKQLVCINCAVSMRETETFIKKTGKGKIISGDPDPDMNGPCGWVCPTCYKKATGLDKETPKWTDDSPSYGNKLEAIEAKTR